MKRAKLNYLNWPSYCHFSFLTFPPVHIYRSQAQHSLLYMSAKASRSYVPSKSVFPEPDLKYAFLPLISTVATYPCHPYNPNLLKNGGKVTISGLVGSSTCPWVIYEVRFSLKVDFRSQFDFISKHSGSLNTLYSCAPTHIMTIWSIHLMPLGFSAEAEYILSLNARKNRHPPQRILLSQWVSALDFWLAQCSLS